MDNACLTEHCRCHPEDPVCLTLWKSEDATDQDRFIEGLASVDIRDTEGEIVHPDKLDFTYLDKGKAKINWIHKSDPDDQLGTIVGYKIGLVKDVVPQKYHDRVKGFLNHIGVWIRARLKHGLKKAESVWTDMNANPNDHGLGFSLQGTAQRSGTDVIGGMVTNAALTPNPVLAETFAVLSKALATSYARSDQTGFQATVPEDLRDQIISTTVTGSKYGDNPKGGWLGSADAIVGYAHKRNPNNNESVSVPIKRSHRMPAGEPVHIPLDIDAATRALKSFLSYVRAQGAHRGNVLDGSQSYFELHGLDRDTARALAKYVRQNASKLFRKCFPGLGTQEETSAMTDIERLEKALTETTVDGAAAPANEPAATAAATALNKSKDEPADLNDDATATHEECPNCAYERLVKGCTSCPQCGTSLAKSVANPVNDPTNDAAAGETEFLDVTQLIKSIDQGLKTSEKNENVLAKSVLHVVQSNNALGALVKSHGQRLEAQATLISDLRKELADDRSNMIKSLDAVCERLGIIGATPRPKKSAETIEKSKTDGSSAQPGQDTPEVLQEYQNYLLNGHVTSDMTIAIRSGHLSKSQAVELIKAGKGSRLEKANGRFSSEF